MTGVVVFGRQPVPGRVKTRLAADVGEEAAARVYAALLDYTIDTAVAATENVVLSLAEAPAPGWPVPGAVRVEVQGRGNLGRRMHEAFVRRFREGWGRVVLIGSDCACLRPEHLLRAAEALERRPVVLGPAEDGGFWLVGQRPPAADIFTGVRWSEPQTMESTRRRLRFLNLGWSELATLPDVDTKEDLKQVLGGPREVDSKLRRWLEAAVSRARR